MTHRLRASCLLFAAVALANQSALASRQAPGDGWGGFEWVSPVPDPQSSLREVSHVSFDPAEGPVSLALNKVLRVPASLDAAASLQGKLLFVARQIGWKPPPPAAPLPRVDLATAIAGLYGAAGVDVTPAIREQIAVATAGLDARVAEPLSGIVSAVASAARDRNEAFAGVTPAEWEQVRGWFENSDGTKLPPADVTRPLKEKMDTGLMLRGTLTLLDAKDANIPVLKWITMANSWPVPGPWADPLGFIFLGTPGKDYLDWSTGKWITIDPDGNDEWDNNAGGATPRFHCVNGVICSGGEKPLLGGSTPCVPGPGCIGPASAPTPFASNNVVGFMVDMGGDDNYHAIYPYGPANWRGFVAQGGAFAGIGYLEDQGGDNEYWGGLDSQGSAAFGIGILNLTGPGKDAHITYGEVSMGSGGASGIGILTDWGGDDTYTALNQIALGSANAESAGILEDKAGTDSYFDRYGTGGGYLPPHIGVGYARFLDRGAGCDWFFRFSPIDPEPWLRGGWNGASWFTGSPLPNGEWEGMGLDEAWGPRAFPYQFGYWCTPPGTPSRVSAEAVSVTGSSALKARLTNAATGAGIPGKAITFTVGQTILCQDVLTDAGGYATCASGHDAAVAGRGYEARFAGDEAYASSVTHAGVSP